MDPNGPFVSCVVQDIYHLVFNIADIQIYVLNLWSSLNAYAFMVGTWLNISYLTIISVHISLNQYPSKIFGYFYTEIFSVYFNVFIVTHLFQFVSHTEDTFMSLNFYIQNSLCGCLFNLLSIDLRTRKREATTLNLIYILCSPFW